MLWQSPFILICLQVTGYCSEDYFITHLLRNLRNDILHLKPGSNKTYILNHNLLGRNDSIELDIRSRVKEASTNNKENEKGILEVNKQLKHKHKQEAINERRHRVNQRRKAMLREIEEIRKKNAEKIRQLKHKESGGRKKIRIKVVRKHQADDVQPMANKTKGTYQTFT